MPRGGAERDGYNSEFVAARHIVLVREGGRADVVLRHERLLLARNQKVDPRSVRVVLDGNRPGLRS